MAAPARQHETAHSSEADDELPALQKDDDILKRHNLMVWSGEDDATERGPASVPPPHLAKRLHHPGMNRRRSSAASSRRNSITSSQSHHSSRSYRSSCNRNYIDQHLRRASILEDRKARLADRAAHAEQVRLRAALAKAAPRGSNTEEKALAAQQARERYLAKVAATCAEEVNRAKRVAEENKERRAAEEQRFRQELEDKYAEAERRRNEYRRTPRRTRTTSMANPDEPRAVDLGKKPITEEVAKMRIHRAWSQYRRRRTVKAFCDLNLSIDRVRQASFDEATELLANENAIASTKALLRQLGLEVGSEKESTPVRTFLSAFMMLGHATDVFSKTGQQEQELISKAKDLLISFESILSELGASAKTTASPTHLQTLHQAHAAYSTAFSAWKSRDASIIIETMVDQFVALDSIWQTVKDDTRGDVASEYRDGIRNQQIILLSKIKKLAGADRSSTLIKRAIRESRRQRTTRRPPGDVRPRPVAEPAADSVGAGASTEAFGPGELPSASPETQDLGLTGLSRVFSIIPSNRVLVHELMIDPNFKIEVSPQSDVRNALNREVCESMRRAVAQGQSEEWTVAVAENVQKRLLKLLKPGNSIHRMLTEVLDQSHVRQQCQHGQFSYERFFAFMADLLPRLCAPVRDPEVKALAETLKSPVDSTDAMIEKLFGLLHVIDLLSLDYTNYLVGEKAELLIREGAGYEQRAFASDLETHRISLTRTTRWWRNASLNAVTESNTLDPSPSSARPSFARIYARGLVDLAAGLGPIRDTDLPETLALDAARLARVRSDVLRFTTVGGILLTAKNLLKRDVRSQWKPEARRIFESLKDAESNGGIAPDDLAARVLAIVESSHGMPPSSRGHLASIITRFLAEARAQQLSDPVLKLLLQRLKLHLFNRLAAQSSVERVRVASTTSEGLAAIGIGEFIGQIGALAEELGKVAAVDQAGHQMWLRQIATDSEGLADGT